MKTYDTFVTVLADHINKRTSKIEVTDELIDYARKHHLQSVFCYQLEKRENVRNYCIGYAVQYLKRQGVENEIKKIFTAAGLPYFFVKGTAVAVYYPTPALRTMSDSDVVVKDREIAKKLLQENGFVLENDKTSDWHFRKNEIHIELHSQLLYGGLLNPESHMAFFNDCWKYVNNNELDWNFHFLFLLEHLRKHLVWEGVGFRQFMDLAVMIKYGSDLFDWKWITKQLKKLDLLMFANRCFALIERWFDVKSPIEIYVINDEFYDFASQTILENGVFGFDSNKYNDERNREVYLHESESGLYQIVILRRFFNRCFPSYAELVSWPQYQFIEGKKFLLPVCWIYRLFKSLFSFDKWRKNVNWSYVSKETFLEYNNDLKRWGL